MYKIADRLILDWSAMEGSMCGTSVLNTNSIKAVKETAEDGLVIGEFASLDQIDSQIQRPVAFSIESRN